MKGFNVQLDYQMNERDTEVISNGLSEFNFHFFGQRKCISFALYLRDDKHEIVGGILAWMKPGIKLLCIDTIWIKEDLRKQGFGKKLIQAAENEGIKNGCAHSQLETLPFQAEEFYRKLGYIPIGRVEKMYGEHDAIYMRKNLKGAS